MVGGSDKDKVDLECPKCGTKFQTTQAQAEKGRVKCPKGHEFEVMGLLGGGGIS
jgi:peptide subunit release factor 1 (eRF1)